MKYITFLFLIFLSMNVLAQREPTIFDDLLSMVWKWENPGGITGEPINSMSEEELLEGIKKESSRLNFQDAQKRDVVSLLTAIYNNASNETFKNLLTKISESGLDLKNMKIYTNSHSSLLPFKFAYVSSCNIDLAKAAVPYIKDFSEVVTKESSFGAYRSNSWNDSDKLYYFEAIFKCYWRSNVNPNGLEPKWQEYYRAKREYFGELAKKALFNFGSPLTAYNDRRSIIDELTYADPELLEYYLNQGYADSNYLQENAPKHLVNLIRSGADSQKIAQFIEQYNINIRTYSKEIERALISVNSRYNRVNFDEVYKINSLLLKKGLSLASDKSIFFNFMNETIDLATKSHKKVMKHAMLLLDLYLEYAPEHAKSQKFKNRISSLWSDYFKYYYYFKINQPMNYSVWSQQELHKMINLGLPTGLIKYFISKGFDLNYQGDYGDTPLMTAVKNDRAQLVDYLLSKKVNVEVWNIAGESAISLSKSVDVLEIFIKHGYDITMQNQSMLLCIQVYCGDEFIIFKDNGQTIAHTAAKKGALNVLKVIRDKNSRLLSQKDSDNMLPLNYAIASGHVEVVEYLLNYSELKNLDNNGRNLLFFAIQANNLELVKLFVGKGISVFEANNKGITPYQFAKQKVGVNPQIVEFLESLLLSNNQDSSGISSNDANRIFMLIRDNKNDELERILVNNPSLLNVRDEFNITPLIFAVNYNNLEMVAMFVGLGADVSARDDFGMTALDHARDLGFLKIENYLDNFF